MTAIIQIGSAPHRVPCEVVWELRSRHVSHVDGLRHGALTGRTWFERGIVWFEVETDTGRWRWPRASIADRIVVPAPVYEPDPVHVNLGERL